MGTDGKPERRAAARYRVPGQASLFWDGAEANAVKVTVRDVSAHGCLVHGDAVPIAGTRVFLSLEIEGLPNIRLPAVAVRSERRSLAKCAAIRFEVPVASTEGMDALLKVEERGQTA